MDKKEMRTILAEELSRFRDLSYEKLTELVNKNHMETSEAIGAHGKRYQIEVQFFWDDQADGNVRVSGSIDENPHKPVFDRFPLLRWIPIYVTAVSDSFIMSPAGNFVGE